MESEKVHFIYVTENLINGKLYIGQHTCNYDKQFTDGYLGSGRALKNAVKKYGAENFSRIILEYAESPEELNELEAKYVDEEVINSKMFYNIKTGGIQNTVWNQEVRKRKSESMKKSTVSQSLKQHYIDHPEARVEISQRSKKMWESYEFREKFSESSKGIKHHISEEARISAKNKRKEWWESLTVEERQKISDNLRENAKRLWESADEEKKARITSGLNHGTPWNKGRHGIYSEETIEKLRKANTGKPSPNKGRKYTEEQRKAKSECMKRWAQRRKETLIANGRTEDEVCGWHLKHMQNEKE